MTVLYGWICAKYGYRNKEVYILTFILDLMIISGYFLISC